jgi:hypothetical protein
MPGKEDTYACITIARKSSPLMRQQLPLGFIGRAKDRRIGNQRHPIPRKGAHGGRGDLGVGL